MFDGLWAQFMRRKKVLGTGGGEGRGGGETRHGLPTTQLSPIGVPRAFLPLLQFSAASSVF